MQEEFGGEEKVAAAEHVVVAEKKKPSKKKERKIPTVEDVVAAETADDSNESGLFSQKDDSGERTEIFADEADYDKSSAGIAAEEIEGDRPDESVAPVNSETVSADDAGLKMEAGTADASAEENPSGQKASGLEAVKGISPEIERAVDEAVAGAAEEESGQDFAGVDLDSEMALLEAVLFLESEPQSSETLGKITKLSEAVVDECVERLKFKYTNVDCGIEITRILGGWILTPKRECFEVVKERYGKKNEGKLSKAAIETLSIIAYSQPITRAEIESIRHVNVDNMMRILLDRKFIKETGKKDIPGKPVTYGTTDEFLEFFHLQSIAELPQLDDKENERFQLAR